MAKSPCSMAHKPLKFGENKCETKGICVVYPKIESIINHIFTV